MTGSIGRVASLARRFCTGMGAVGLLGPAVRAEAGGVVAAPVGIIIVGSWAARGRFLGEAEPGAIAGVIGPVSVGVAGRRRGMTGASTFGAAATMAAAARRSTAGISPVLVRRGTTSSSRMGEAAVTVATVAAAAAGAVRETGTVGAAARSRWGCGVGGS